MLQNATPLRKSPPWSPNTSTSCVSCIVPATRNASFQILFKCPTPAMVFETATKLLLIFDKVHNLLRLPLLNVQKCSVPFCFFTFLTLLRATTTCTFSTCRLPKVVRAWRAVYNLTWKRALRHNGAHFSDSTTSKSAPTLVCFVRFYFEMCFAPQQRALFRQLNFQKC